MPALVTAAQDDAHGRSDFSRCDGGLLAPAECGAIDPHPMHHHRELARQAGPGERKTKLLKMPRQRLQADPRRPRLSR